MTTAPISRTWLAFSALGAGMIHLALSVDSPIVVKILLLALGLAEFGWGVLALARDDLVFARTARIVAFAPVIAWSLLVVAATLLDSSEMATMLPLIPMAAATVFELTAAVLISQHLRRRRTADADADAHASTPAGTGRYLLGVLAGAVVAGLLISPALSATGAGASATSHGGHGVTEPASTPAPLDDPLAELELPEHDDH